jgi:hypothetical protein
MANYVAILKKGMDMTPGGKDESAVLAAERLGEEVDLEWRVELLVETTCYVMFNYVAQVGVQTLLPPQLGQHDSAGGVCIVLSRLLCQLCATHPLQGLCEYS